MPEFAKHYGVQLTGIQPLQFLVYREGDFFERHRDRGERRAQLLACSPEWRRSSS